MSFNSTPYKSRPAPGQLGSTPFRSSSTSKFRSSLVPSSRPSPARSPMPPSSKSTKTSTSTSGRDLFRTSTPRPQRTTEFAPDLPVEATRAPASVRKFAPRKSVTSGMSNTASTEPFTLRIPSPDPDLTGQVLAKAVPDDPSRTGSIYADQFLAHKCPSHFDDVQRRQFFCILDLRRLKYTADEIFTKKDWKLNILNFAKEYEKSRGLIMLRYGLYEFKTVKPSNAVLKKWRAAHGLTSETEADHSSSPSRSRVDPAGSSKRKFEEDSTSRDSNVNQNKRRNLAQEVNDSVLNKPAPFKKSKRKADETEELDESKPNKQQKSTPSTATSLFESILNKTRNDGPSPSKQTSQPASLFAISKSQDTLDSKFATKANPFTPSSSSLFPNPAKPNIASTLSGSVLADHKIGSTPAANTGNIFSYLSESSPSSDGNEDDNADEHESDSGAEPDSDEQNASAAVSTGTSTPPVQNGSLFGVDQKTSQTPSIFGGLSKPADQTTKGGLFGRIQMGANGQPVRANARPDEKREGALNASNQFSTPSQQQTKTPAKQPGDYTFNPATTPISFGKPTPEVSKASATTSSVPTTESVPSEPEKPVSIFGLNSVSGQTNNSGLKSDAPSLFASSQSTKPQSSETPISIFASQKPASASSGLFGATPTGSAVKSSFGDGTPTSSSIFGATPVKRALGGDEAPASTSIFDTTLSSAAKGSLGSNEQTPDSQSAGKEQAVSIFSKPPTTAAPAEKKSLDNKVDDKTVSNTPAVKNQTPSIFDKSFIAAGAAQIKASSDNSKGSLDLFSRNSNPLFGTPKDDKTVPSVPATETKAETKAEPKTETKTPSIFDKSFIAESAAQIKASSDKLQASSGLFERGSNPLFGATAQSKASSDNLKPASDLFAPGPGSNSLFAVKPATPSNDSKSIFDQPKNQSLTDSAPSKEKTQTPNDSNKENAGSVLGSKALAPSTATPSIFGTQGTSNLGASSTLFGTKKQEEPTKPAPSIFGSTSTASPIFGFGSQPNAKSNTQSTSMTFGTSAASSPAVSFGAPSSQPNANKIDFQFGSSVPNTSSSFTFGQNSSSTSGFTFSAGADKQAVNNPFTGSQPGSQLSAPVFGSNSPAPSPSSSFNFSFGQQPSSDPKTAAAPPSQGVGLFGNSTKTNGAPSFSFTQASPGQNGQTPSDIKFPNPSGHLQASGDGSTRANSPFPVPSSIGTTPVNGTPEPHAPQEDGEEAPHAQISLTDGGPGEEDETLVHEVRAKAIKYIPVKKDDEDQEKSQSPWSTRGVGPLRILKNKSTGAVRILLRAEPRGHVALNKAILPDVEYKPKSKTVNFVAADDNGSGLETWLLQVKTAELAAELAGVLETNKTANKK